MMGLGSLLGRKNPAALETPQDRTHELNKAGGIYDRFGGFVHEFKGRFGSVVCGELTAGFPDFKSKERRLHCLHLVETAAGMAAKYALCPPGAVE